MKTNMSEMLNAERKIGHSSLKELSLIIIPFFFIVTGCLKDEVTTDTPKTGLEQIQLHNFNLPLSGGSLEGSAPDLYYFRQKEDGSYVLMLSSTNYQGFETNWATDYVLVTTDARGIIQKTEEKKFPVKDGIIGIPDRVFEAGTPPPESPLASELSFFSTSAVGPNYGADDKGFLYFRPDDPCSCRNVFFNLHPETGQTEFFSTGGERPLAQIFRTSDGGFMAVGGGGAPDYHKFSSSGVLEFKQPMRYFEAWPAYVYLTGRNGDQYFITTYGLPFPDPTGFSENTAKSFFNLRYWQAFMPPIDVEIRFGPGKTQKAHRFNRHFSFDAGASWQYQDYVDVPFEVWDLTNNQQIMAWFRDQGEDGVFNLVPMNIDWRGFPYFPGPFNDDPDQSQEWIGGNLIPYSSTPNADIMSLGPFGWYGFVIMGYLTAGATWNPSALPSSSVSIKLGPRPGTQLLKVNANGSSVVKDNYTLGTVPFQNMFKAVPYLDGSAVLINVPSPNYVNPPVHGFSPPTQLVLLDADFNQKAAQNMISNVADHSHQLEYNKEKDRIFYARMTNNPNGNTDNAYKGSLLLSVIRNNKVVDKYLDDLIPFKLEKYRMTPTKTGGVAIAAWVRPTKDTRDLLFLELDENLELVKK